MLRLCWGRSVCAVATTTFFYKAFPRETHGMCHVFTPPLRASENKGSSGACPVSSVEERGTVVGRSDRRGSTRPETRDAGRERDLGIFRVEIVARGKR